MSQTIDNIEDENINFYLKDETLLKIIRRSKKLSSFILDDPRTNVKLLEKFIMNTKRQRDVLLFQPYYHL